MLILSISLPVAGYLIGSLSSAILISRLLHLPDPRAGGSGNPGATNVLRLGGKKAAVLTLAGDLVKGWIPVLTAAVLGADDMVIAATGLSAFLGHLFPVFFGFKGGKGVATAAGVCAAISWQAILILIGCWLATALASRYSALSSLIAAAAMPFIFLQMQMDPAYVLMAIVMTALVVWRHQANIGRLIRGEESRIRLFTRKP